ncbi:MAG: DUF3883 domain-containing protein [Chloroflexi bacterium]|nr:DUF3883 domain-containing protein [Chloroflexota bacterium]MYK60979.1 DUF3883 domain-containing protein [Chloroflexota bacterium]
MTLPAGTWLTGPRLDRLATALQTIGANVPGVPRETAVRRIWRKCGGSHEESEQLLNLLASLNLFHVDEDSVRRANSGNPVVRGLRSGDYRPLGLTIIRAGLFSDQARALLEIGNMDAEGDLICLPRIAQSVAPQLVGLLSRWPEFQSRPLVCVPSNVVGELETVWALRMVEASEPSWISNRRRIGQRAELYSFQRERSITQNPSSIAWVSQDSDSFGWDIEDRTTAPYRRIEVKGSGAACPAFFLSQNEWNQAARYGSNYEVQFWGSIDLQREQANEYASLRAAGFPIVISDIRAKITTGEWDATPVQWRIARN